MGNDAANERDDKAARGLSGGAEVGGRDDVDAGGEKAGEVDAQAGDRTGRERRVVLAVEHGGDGGGEHENKDVHQCRDDERGGDGQRSRRRRSASALRLMSGCTPVDRPVKMADSTRARFAMTP